MASPISIRIFCHACADECTAHVNADRELLCDACDSAFVEELDQGIEEFLEEEGDIEEEVGEEYDENYDESNPGMQSDPHEDMYLSSDSSVSPSASAGSNDASNSDAMSSLLQSLENITRTFNANAARRTTQRVLRSDGSRPIEMIVHQTTVNGGNAGISQGLMSLLGAIANSRQQAAHHNADALSNAGFEQLLHHILMNETSHAGAPPASETLIAQLSRQMVTADTHVDLKGECSISQETFEVGDIVVSLPCGHRYKEDPIVHWLKMHNTCPVCRIEVPQAAET